MLSEHSSGQQRQRREHPGSGCPRLLNSAAAAAQLQERSIGAVWAFTRHTLILNLSVFLIFILIVIALIVVLIAIPINSSALVAVA